MAMLAEPRQRKRYNLVPRGKALYEDDNRFGTKMLEKMGWKKGNGLGAKQEGSKDFVRVRYKNDALGLGFEERDDQWTQHEQDFTGFLKVLNNEGGSSKVEDISVTSDNETQPRVGFGFHETSNMEQSNSKPEKMKEKISGISLEERSRQSKARVHYKKFTKGKDLAQYSEKDLANIFGKKAIEVQDATNDLYQNLNNAFGTNLQNPTGVQIINTGVSVDDYFKTKLESLRNPKNNSGVVENSTEDITSNDMQSEKSTGKRSKKRKRQDIEEEKGNEQECTSQIIYSNISTTEYFKTKMEALKNKKNNINNKEETVNNVISNDELLNEDGSSKRKKKKKEIKNEVNNFTHIHAVKKKSKKDKYPDEEIVESNGIDNEEVFIKKELTSEIFDEQENAECCYSGEKCKKEKSKKKKQIVVEAAEELMTNKQNITTLETGITKSDTDDKKVTSDSESRVSRAEKRNNKLKRINELSVAPNKTDELSLSNLVNENTDLDEKAKKKKSKFKSKQAVDISQIETSAEMEINEEPAKKKKNKDKKKTKINESVADDNDVVSNSEYQEVKASNEAVSPPVATSAGEKSKKEKKIVFKNEFSDAKNCHLDDAKTVDCAVEYSEDITLTEGPKKKKSKNKKTPERTQTGDCDKNVDVNFENQTFVAEENTPNKDIEISGTTNYTEELNISHQFQEKPLKCRQNVSSTAKNFFISDVNFGMLDIEEIKRQYNSFNIYPISSFCAEKFRNINLDSFVGSSLSQLEGYGLSKDVQIEVRFTPLDDERITNLWKFALNKYEQTNKSKRFIRDYRDYVKEVRTAQRKKIKIPKLNIKAMKRRNMFSSSII